MKLVPAKCPSCGAGVELDPGAEQVTCPFCHTTSFIESEHQAAPPQASQVIRVEPQVSGAGLGRLGCLILLPLIVAIGGVGLSTVVFVSAVPSSPSRTSPKSKPAPAAKSAAPHFLGKDAVKAPKLFAPHFGKDIEAASLVLYDRHATLTAKVPDGFDHQTHVNGKLSDPKPESSSRHRDTKTFRLGRVKLSQIPKLKSDALKRAKLGKGAEVTHIYIERTRDGPLEIRVYVRTERDSTMVRYDRNGKFVR